MARTCKAGSEQLVVRGWYFRALKTQLATFLTSLATFASTPAWRGGWRDRMDRWWTAVENGEITSP
jgi:hypothetical protein